MLDCTQRLTRQIHCQQAVQEHQVQSKTLLSDGFLDPDAPNPDIYPQGIMLWNTRRTGYNVKEYKNNYITTTKYPGSGSAGLGNIRASNESVATYFPDRWVTKSSNNADGSGSFGRKAQRKVIVEQLNQRSTLTKQSEKTKEDSTLLLHLVIQN